MTRVVLTGLASLSEPTVIEYVRDSDGERPRRPGDEALPTARFRVRARMRVPDKRKRDPNTGAYAAGPRVDVWAYTKSSTPRVVAKAVQDAAMKRLMKDEPVAAPGALTVHDHCEAMLERLKPGKDLAVSTHYLYTRHVDRHMRDGIGKLRLEDVTTGLVDQHLKRVSTLSGVSAAKHSRTVLNRVYSQAIRDGLIDHSPMTSLGRLKGKPKGGRKLPTKGRSLTREERVELAWAVARSERAVRWDLRDLVLLGLVLGGRLGELLAVRWKDVHLNPNGYATVTLSGSVGRDIGAGKGIVRGPVKTERSTRTLPIPRRSAALLRRRANALAVDFDGDGFTLSEWPVFPPPGRWETQDLRDRLRDKANVTHRVRDVFDEAGFPWLSMHGLRRTVITSIADARPIRVAADFAGHASIRTTLEAYVARGRVTDDVADLL